MKPRKKYRPRPVHANAVEIAINGARKLSYQDVERQRGIVCHALIEFTAGRDCAQHWRSLADTANMAETFVGMGICSGTQAEEVVERAQAALAAVQQRHAARGTWTLYGAEIDALQWLAALHLKQLAECSYAEFERAFHTTRERIAQAIAGNAPKGAVVIRGDIAARVVEAVE